MRRSSWVWGSKRPGMGMLRPVGEFSLSFWRVAEAEPSSWGAKAAEAERREARASSMRAAAERRSGLAEKAREGGFRMWRRDRLR